MQTDNRCKKKKKPTRLITNGRGRKNIIVTWQFYMSQLHETTNKHFISGGEKEKRHSHIIQFIQKSIDWLLKRYRVNNVFKLWCRLFMQFESFTTREKQITCDYYCSAVAWFCFKQLNCVGFAVMMEEQKNKKSYTYC